MANSASTYYLGCNVTNASATSHGKTEALGRYLTAVNGAETAHPG